MLGLAERRFDVLVTLDKNLPFQQNLDAKRIAVLVVRARSNRIQDLLPIIPECLAVLTRIRPGEVVYAGLLPSR
ncbi:MAG: hypothetical protein U0Q16_12020 [Bryobacteraceae bacterium]